MFKKFELKKEESQVEDYEFKKFGLKVTPSAEKYEETIHIETKPFEINKNSANKSGVSYLKEKRIKNTIDSEVARLLEIEKSKIFEEYKAKGYEKGIDGANQACKVDLLKEYKEDILNSYAEFEKVIFELKNLNTNLKKESEQNIKTLIKIYAEKLCMHEVEVNDKHYKEMLDSVFDLLPSTDDLKIIISKELKDKLDFLLDQIKSENISKKIEIVIDESLTDNDMKIETLSGEIDISFEERMKRVWKSIE